MRGTPKSPGAIVQDRSRTIYIFKGILACGCGIVDKRHTNNEPTTNKIVEHTI